MGFIDELEIFAKAGDGGNGVVRWLREKNNPKGGPSGGNGGNGGDVYVNSVRDIHLLAKYRHNPEFFAKNGDDGAKDNLYGENGDDFYIDLPIGSIITNKENKKEYELKKEGESFLILKGGRGGRGNTSFKSSTNQVPQESTDGMDGESAKFDIEIQLFADIGLIGLPSVGKTSLLNSLTGAHGKIGDYPFTTLEPNLGEFYGFVIADIPGLIEGASEGKGLGYKFLRHIRRTKILAHLISFEYENPMEEYKKIRKELGDYDKKLLGKQEVIILTKSDMVTVDKIKKYKKEFEKITKSVFVLSLYDNESIKIAQDGLVKLL